MRIDKIYERYSIPLNLRRHMLQVAAVGKIVVSNLSVKVDDELLVKTLLLHDMGNLIKFDFERVDFFEGKDKERIEELKALKDEWVGKYGVDADVATLKIIKEISDDEKLGPLSGSSPRLAGVVWLCEHSHGDNIREILDKQAWEQKVAYYADMRVGPFGIVSVAKRFDNLMERYYESQRVIEKYGDPYAIHRRFRRECLEIERQLQEISGIDLKRIDEEMVANEMAGLREIEI